MTPRLPHFIDIEASGFGRGSYPIEIGLAMPTGQTHCFLIRPMDNWTHWDDSAEDIHGISRDVLCQRGRPALEVAMAINLLVSGKTLYTDAWGMDNSWLSRLFAETGVLLEFRLETVRKLLDESQASRFHQTREDVLVDNELKRHRASSDALILQKTYARLAED